MVTHHQKSSTVSKEYTARSVVPHVCDLVEPFGLSNHSVHLCSSGCFWPASGSVLLGADASVALLGGAVAGWAASSDMLDERIEALRDICYVTICTDSSTYAFVETGGFTALAIPPATSFSAPAPSSSALLLKHYAAAAAAYPVVSPVMRLRAASAQC